MHLDMSCPLCAELHKELCNKVSLPPYPQRKGRRGISSWQASILCRQKCVSLPPAVR